jgi:hypothetical protein
VLEFGAINTEAGQLGAQHNLCEYLSYVRLAYACGTQEQSYACGVTRITETCLMLIEHVHQGLRSFFLAYNFVLELL